MPDRARVRIYASQGCAPCAELAALAEELGLEHEVRPFAWIAGGDIEKLPPDWRTNGLVEDKEEWQDSGSPKESPFLCIDHFAPDGETVGYDAKDAPEALRYFAAERASRKRADKGEERRA